MTIQNLITWFADAIRSERGASLAEYGLVTVLIAIVAIAAVTLAGGETSEMYSTIASDLDNAGS